MWALSSQQRPKAIRVAAHQREGEHHGMWWLAKERDRRVPGALVVNERGEPRLKLVGSLGIAPDGIFDSPEGQLRILGELENMSGATLEGCMASGSTGGLRQRRQEWHVSEAVFGAHFTPDEPWAFYGAGFSVPLLTRWISQAITELELESDASGATKRLGIAVSLESWPLWGIQDGEVTLVRAGSTKNASETVLEVESRIDLRIRRAVALSRDEMHALAVRPLQVLLALSTGQFTTAMSGSTYLATADSAEGRRSYDWVWHPHEFTCNTLKADYGFSYSDIASLGLDALQKWTERLPGIEPVVNLYLASLRQLGYSELTFLLIAQALETLHRRESSATIIDNELWKVLGDRLRANVKDVVRDMQGSGEIKAQLIGKLSYLNEPGLRIRLKHLLGRLGDVGLRVCGGDLSGFVGQVVDTRNYYTHWSADLEPKALRGEHLLYATSRLLAVLELLLLTDLGLGLESKAAEKILHRRVSWLPNR